jgi:hypothetical protein
MWTGQSAVATRALVVLEPPVVFFYKPVDEKVAILCLMPSLCINATQSEDLNWTPLSEGSNTSTYLVQQSNPVKKPSAETGRMSLRFK